MTDFDRYAVVAGTPAAPDFFVPADRPPPPGVEVLKMSDLTALVAKLKR